MGQMNRNRVGWIKSDSRFKAFLNETADRMARDGTGEEKGIFRSENFSNIIDAVAKMGVKVEDASELIEEVKRKGVLMAKNNELAPVDNMASAFTTMEVDAPDFFEAASKMDRGWMETLKPV